MLGSLLISLGIVTAVVVLCVLLMVFLPSNKSFYTTNIFKDNYDWLSIVSILCKNISERNNRRSIRKFLSSIEECDWCVYPGDSWMTAEKNQIFKYIPFIKGDKERYELNFYNSIDCKSNCILSETKGVVSCGLLKIENDSITNPHKTWKTLGNATLRCLIPIKSPSSDLDDCGLWVEGSSKRIKKGEIIIFDHSKNWSIYNKENSSCVFIFIDIIRPDDIQAGSSEFPDLEIV